MEETNLLQDLKPFDQKPYWNPDAEFVISGAEFERLFVTLQPFLGAAFIMQGIMQKGIEDGTVKIKYEYLDGSGEVPEQDVKIAVEHFTKMLEQQKQAQAKGEIAVEDNVKPLNKKSKIITQI